MENQEELNALTASSIETPFSEINALSAIQTPTNSAWIKSRSVNGRTLSYVSGDLVIRLLNKAFRNRWSFEIKETRIIDSVDKVFTDKKTGETTTYPQNPVAQVLGRLTVPGWGVREQWGAQPIVGGQDTQEHALKSAGTDALKKCASMFGITLDLYGQEGMYDLLITPEDYLTNDNTYFDKLKEKLKERSANPIQPAEPDLITESINEQDNIPFNTPSQEKPETVVPYSREEKVEVEEKPKEVVPPAPAPSQPVSDTWKQEDVVDMKNIKSQLGLQNNNEFDVYVKQYMGSEEATMAKHITPANIRDFITYLQHNHLK